MVRGCAIGGGVDSGREELPFSGNLAVALDLACCQVPPYDIRMRTFQRRINPANCQIDINTGST
jgi:hypothetical protein